MKFGSFTVFKDVNSRAELELAYDKLSCNTEKSSFKEVYERINKFIQPFADNNHESLSWSPSKGEWERQLDGPNKKDSDTEKIKTQSSSEEFSDNNKTVNDKIMKYGSFNKFAVISEMSSRSQTTEDKSDTLTDNPTKPTNPYDS